MGEGLKVDEARDAAFLITGSGMWVGKPAYLTADPMTLLEGRRGITCAISDQRVKARGPGRPRVNQPAQQPFRFDVFRTPPPKGLKSQRDSDRTTPRWPARGRGHNRRRRDQRQRYPGFLPLCQIEVSKVIGVRRPWRPPCHPSLTIQIGLDALDMVGDIRRKLV